jgi:DNA-binding Lrp family transcriptional regulator
MKRNVTSTVKSHQTVLLSDVDKTILRFLLDPRNGKKSSLDLSRKVGIPVTTLRRRRRRLEAEFLDTYYALKIEKFGWRRIELYISTKNGMIDTISNQLLDFSEVTYVGKSIGQHTIDMRVKVIIKDNGELLDLIERVKGMNGVNDVIWSEIVQVVGRKRSIPNGVLDKF